jgi:uridine kinase
MVGDVIDQSKVNQTAANALLQKFPALLSTQRLVLAVAGESGSGKTHMAAALEFAFKQNGKNTLVLHMDDFFKLPPAQNHQKRLQNIAHVGPQEVDLARLTAVLQDFKGMAKVLQIPQVHYYEDSIEEVEVQISDIDVLIIEGTYTFELEHLDFQLFMSRTFEETRELRMTRNRGNEAADPFVEKVLAIEHLLICRKKMKANAFIDYHFNLQINE